MACKQLRPPLHLKNEASLMLFEKETLHHE